MITLNNINSTRIRKPYATKKSYFYNLNFALSYDFNFLNGYFSINKSTFYNYQLWFLKNGEWRHEKL